MKFVFHLLMILFFLNLVRSQNNETTPTLSPNTSTTSAPVTTPVPSIPTPTEGSWNVTDGNITCIRADLKVRFMIPVGNETEYLLLPPDAATVGSSCNATNNTQLLILSRGNFSLTFVFGKDSGKTFVENIIMNVTLLKGKETFSNDSKQFSVQDGNSYMCKSITSVQMGSVTMEVLDIHIQAFAAEEKDFATAEQCEADDIMNDVVPIVVACSLAGLIIIVLIAYLIGRRRSRQKGYTSV